MHDVQQEIRFFTYCRKSTDDPKRQIASISDQINALQKLAKDEELSVVGNPFQESKTSKKPGRPLFNEMLDRIERGEADGILCWDIDRLYRNPVDEGRLRWMLQNGVIRVIRTPYRVFYPDDAGLLMGVEGGRATDYVIRLSKNVKRAIGRKLDTGWRPGPAPIGYLNIGEAGTKTIIPDPERFDLVRKMWDLFLSGYSVSQTREIATKEWGLKTRPTRKQGGRPLSMSHMYKIFNESFYYGWYWWKNPATGIKELYKGEHQAMITELEYRRVQTLLGKKGKPQPKTRLFAYTGLMRCGECDSSITAEAKNQLICTKCKYKFAYENKTACPKCKAEMGDMKNPTILNYVYYHCTKKKNKDCSQGSIRVEELEAQFEEKLQTLNIGDDYLKLALDYLQEHEEVEVNDEKSIRQSLQVSDDNCQTRLNNLHREYTSPQNVKHELYSPEEFKHQKNVLMRERTGIEEEMKKVRERIDRTHELSERTFNFCTYATYNFANGDLHCKKEVFSAIGSNLTLTDGKLSVKALEPYLLIERELVSVKRRFSRLEPEKAGYTKRKEAAFVASTPSWLIYTTSLVPILP